MATISAFIRSTNATKLANVRFRISFGRNQVIYHKTGIKVKPIDWDNKKGTLKNRIVMSPHEKHNILSAINEEKLQIENILLRNQSNFDLVKAYLERRSGTVTTLKDLLNTDITELYKIRVNKLIKTLGEDFKVSKIKSEHIVRSLESLSANSRTNYFVVLNKIFKDLVKNGIIDSNPCEQVEINKTCVYGTPIYITKEELLTLYSTPMSGFVELVRDCFVLQSMLACRISDLRALTKDNIVNGFIEYVPVKTRKSSKVVRVPLNDIAKDIIAKYEHKGNNLIEVCCEMTYNACIRKAFKYAGITRMVIRRNLHTGENESVRICDIVTSHMARRTAIGNLFRVFKDQSLVSAISGHCEGSKAFARYRTIDDDMKTEMVDIWNK